MQFSSRSKLAKGFTLVEMLIIAPVVIIVISGFVALIITLVSDTLVTREHSNMSYETQDALDRIEQDTRLTTQFLATSGAQIAPQGSNSDFTGTAAFTASSSQLILGSLTTDKNPADSTRRLVFYAKQPNDCGAQEFYNRAFQAKVIYFLKNGSLWRRAILPDHNLNVTANDNTVCVAPWQQNTCSPGYGGGTRCQTNDTEVMKNVKTFNVKYLSSP
jgi:Tfp pilus assembly protein PilV